MGTLSDALMLVARRWRLWESTRSRHRQCRQSARELRRQLADAEHEAAQERTARERAEQDAEQATTRADELQDALDIANGRLEVLRSQIELFAAWEARERTRLEAETAMLAARKVRAANEQLGPETPQ